MSKSFAVTLTCLLCLGLSFAQNISHKVQKGENVYRIALKYGVSMESIYNANPGSRSMIRAGEVLMIPSKNTAYKTASGTKGSYVVQKGDTKFGLSQKFNLSINRLESLNPQISSGLQAGQVLRLYEESAGPKKKDKPLTASAGTHRVKKGETVWRISQSYGLTVQELLDANPGLEMNNMQIGQLIKIPDTNNVAKQQEVIKTETVTADTAVIEYVDYEVKSGENLNSLAKKAGMSIDAFVSLNPNASGELKEGAIIKMPKGTTSGVIAKQPSSEVVESSPEAVEQSSNANAARTLLEATEPSINKKVVWFLPASISELSQEETFEFMEAQDLYRGGHLAIEALKAKGFNIEESVVDLSSSSKNQLEQLSMEANLLIAPPLVTSKLDKIRLKEQITFLNFSKNPQTTAATDLQPRATDDQQAEKLLAYLKSKNANIIVLNESKRTKDEEMIKNFAPDAQFVNVKSNGNFSENELIALLIKSKLNVIVINSDEPGVFLNSTNTLLRQYANFDVQLAVMDPALIPSSGQISEKRFRILNLVFPSAVRLEEMSSVSKFSTDYSLKYGNIPSQLAYASYDATYDALLRVFNKDGVEASFELMNEQSTYLDLNYDKQQEGVFNNNSLLIYKYGSESGFEKAD